MDLNSNINRKECFNCECSTFSHSFVVTYWNWEDKEDIEFGMDVGLNETTLLNRIWTAVKYIFKRDESHKWGYSSIIINDKDVIRLSKFINKYIEDKGI
jgi:hypothetical protein